MNIPCCSSIQCPGAGNLDYDTPLANLSSELPDQDVSIGLNFGWDFNLPPIGSNWLSSSCLGVCTSTISQQDADDCAARNQLLCLLDQGWGPPGTGDNGGPRSGPPLIPPPNNPGARYFNLEQTCSITCPDGLLFSWTIGAGYVVATTPIAANQIAFSLACRYAQANAICMGPLDRYVCVNSPYHSEFTTLTTHGPITFDVVSGSMPPGLTPQTGTDGKTLILSGTPTTAGNYVFQLRATDRNGNFMQKTFEIDVLGMTNIAPLPSATEHTFYSTQITTNGAVGTLEYTLLGGTLPGMTLSTSGLVSGTPDYLTAGDYFFTIRVKDTTSGLICTQNGQIHVSLRPGPDWTQLQWTSYPQQQKPPQSHCSGSALANIATAALDKVAGVPNNTFFPKIVGVAAGGFTYTGGAVNCRVQMTVGAASGFNSHLCRIFRNGVGVGGSNLNNTAPGVYTFDFVFPASVNAVISLDDGSPGNSWAEVVDLATAGSLSFTWAIFNL